MNSNASDITIVLDRSGSMASIADDTIGGFNTFLEDQKSLPGDCRLSLVLFDHEYTPVHLGVPIADVPPLTRATFVPRGQTALLDAMGRAIVETGERLAALPESDRPGKVIFAVITDGQENSSREYTSNKVFAMVKEQRETYAWEVVFLGANQDAIQAGGGVGVAAAAALSFAANAGGVQAGYAALSAGTGAYRSGAARGMTFTDEDRAEQKKHGA